MIAGRCSFLEVEIGSQVVRLELYSSGLFGLSSGGAVVQGGGFILTALESIPFGYFHVIWSSIHLQKRDYSRDTLSLLPHQPVP